MRIKSLDPLSLGKVQGAVGALFGLLAGLLIALLSMAGIGRTGGMMPGVGLMAVVIAPIMYGLFGFIGGLIGAVLYNVVAGFVGGIEFQVEQTGAPAYGPPPGYGGPPAGYGGPPAGPPAGWGPPPGQGGPPPGY